MKQEEGKGRKEYNDDEMRWASSSKFSLKEEGGKEEEDHVRLVPSLLLLLSRKLLLRVAA